MISTRQQNELNHDKYILGNREKVWGREGIAGRLRTIRRAKMMIDHCVIGKDKKILEVGCGTGALTELLADTGADITATDIFQEFLEIAKKRINKDNVDFKLADAEKLDNFPDESFDVVCGLSILHHLNIETTLLNIKRVLKKDGYLVFSEPNMMNPQIALQKNIPFLKKIAGDSPDETAFFRWQIKRELLKYGFNDIIAEPFDFLHPLVPDKTANFIEKLGMKLESIPLVKEIAGSVFIVAHK